jgi:hypothetical protein
MPEGLSFGGQIFLAALSASAMDAKNRKAPA